MRSWFLLGGKQRGNLNYVTIVMQNSVKNLFCKYIIVIVVTQKLGPKQPKYTYNMKNKMCPVNLLLKMSYTFYNTKPIRSTDRL